MIDNTWMGMKQNRELYRDSGIEAALRFLHERFRWKAEQADRLWEDYWSVKSANEAAITRKSLKRENEARRLYDVALGDRTELWLAIASLESEYREGRI